MCEIYEQTEIDFNSYVSEINPEGGGLRRNN